MISHDPDALRFVGPRFANVRTVLFPALSSAYDTTTFAMGTIGQSKFLGSWRNVREIGKGQSADATRAMYAAVGETLERHGAVCPPHRARRIFGSHHELSSRYPLLPLAWLQLFSAEQIAQPHFRFKNLEAHDQIEWLECEVLSSSVDEPISVKPSWLPLFRASMAAGPDGLRFDIPTTNGLALGTDREEATSSALHEFLERSAFLDAWWHRRSPPILTSADLKRLHLVSRRDVIDSLGDRLIVLDLSEHWGVPVFVATIWGRGENEVALTVAAASAASSLQAITKAVDEGWRAFIVHRKMFCGENRTDIAPPYEKTVKRFHDICHLYSRAHAAEAARFLVGGKRVVVDDLLRKISTETSNAEIKSQHVLERILAGGVHVVIADVTPVDLASGGLWLMRAWIPEEIPLNCSHEARPFGCLALNSYKIADLNPMPHPFP